ncbi:hypothetical protein [Paracoccus shanxieyensis]|uniref:Uncharacterized protein n=1 Tax=Paracoccus shanxieyensis TaxID=2675752 RepID=A0A6L6IWF5_9RHOB|nr:hypothetical protein [Paracoccus shanxieyensis]MTH64229.1 hypothetical protein [Paracoccus shanxieyensis]MTH87373.1 hypothetical protein [Paracoccus shanxieyensis]
MAEIPNDMIQSLRAALQDLGAAPQEVSDQLRAALGPDVGMAMDDLLAASFQLVEAANVNSLSRAATGQAADAAGPTAA